MDGWTFDVSASLSLRPTCEFASRDEREVHMARLIVNAAVDRSLNRSGPRESFERDMSRCNGGYGNIVGGPLHSDWRLNSGGLV